MKVRTVLLGVLLATGACAHPAVGAGDPPGTGALVIADEIEGGRRSLVARPIPSGAPGLLLPVRNVSSARLTAGRFEIVGEGVPGVATAEADGFACEVDGDRRAFTLRGGSVEPRASVDVRVRFDGPASKRGAIVGWVDEN
jgi:hypothetical protein